MNKNITLGIILFLILVVGLWNPNLLEGVTSDTKDTPPPTKKEQVDVINKQLEEMITMYKKMQGSNIGIQKLKNNLILTLEQVILTVMVQPILNSEKQIAWFTLVDDLLSENIIKYITLYNGLRAMPFGGS